MSGFLRLMFGLLLLPACWGVARVFLDALFVAAGSVGFSAEAVSLVGGIAAFGLCWMTVPHPVKTYVLGHELTHALWSLAFGGRPSDLRVGASGGSVRLTKTNFLVTLAPYFFPFYTFVVIVAGLVTYAFLRPLPFLPLWMFLIGFTWTFHFLFTLETLTERQPDIRIYGRVFSWTVIFLVNVVLLLVWFAATTDVTFAGLGSGFLDRVGGAYVGTWNGAVAVFRFVGSLFSGK